MCVRQATYKLWPKQDITSEVRAERLRVQAVSVWKRKLQDDQSRELVHFLSANALSISLNPTKATREPESLEKKTVW